MIDVISEFAFEPTNELRGRLRHRGGSEASLAGVVLEAAFRLQDAGFLVITSYDSPYEERLELSLLSNELEPLDHDSLGGAYTPGVFSDLSVDSGDQLSFRFAGQRFQVHVRRGSWWSRRAWTLRVSGGV